MSPNNTSVGLEENVEGALCYLLGFITGILFYFLEKRSEFVRFHATQSTILFIGLCILSYLFMFVPFLGSVISIISLLLWLFLMYKAYEGERYKLPVVGDLAEQHMGRLG